MDTATRQQAIATAAAIFAARDLANIKTQRELRSPRTISVVDDAVGKARLLVEVLERKLTD